MSEPAKPNPKTVVICDDNATFVLLMKQFFAKNGFNVRTADDGGDGLTLVRSIRPDLLLLDLEMPVNGMSVLEGLQSLGGKRPYTVVISALYAAETHDKATALGAREIWKKPFSASDLIQRIETLVKEGSI